MEKVRPEMKASKNRHTRPCRYFQTNSCNKSVDECDFAHVIADDSITQRHAKLCRFYLGGYCRNGDSCLFRHDGSGTDGVDSERWEDEVLKESPRSFSSDESSCKFTHLPLLCIPPTSLGSPGSSPSAYWGQMYDGVVSPRYYSEDVVPYYFPVMMTRKSVPITTVRPVTPHLDPRLGDATAVSPSRSRSKAKMYKTKPCKFYRTPEGCPKGGECTFIHEDFEKRIPISTTFTRNYRPELPSKPLSPLEESRKRGFFPITWRVIGGGVLMGVNNSSDTNEGRSTTSRERPERPTVTSENTHTGVPTPTKALETNFTESAPSVPPSAVLTCNMNVPNVPQASLRSSSSSPRTRARANSIPSTPCASQVNTTTLFAAAELP
ncbi:hypothetical protein E1B28_012193 [Marasmius oreades]|uniref:C3H1-type domain-containing protein n=1 Tax=Marasmius oreades TaxID=181124 RepID=A0A9P7UQI6_9AGAR|nr:uncharacterized protein E1B28_012193 [Marasmius oreades]KAG7088174.1 hypothetical protein E1B28_012193 [Marasmius oreades]